MAGIGIAAQLEQIQQDLRYVEREYGSPDNVDSMKLEHYEKLIAEPCKRIAFECIREILHVTAEHGYVAHVGTLGHVVTKALPMFEDDKLKSIIMRWNLPFPDDQH